VTLEGQTECKGQGNIGKSEKKRRKMHAPEIKKAVRGRIRREKKKKSPGKNRRDGRAVVWRGKRIHGLEVQGRGTWGKKGGRVTSIAGPNEEENNIQRPG